MATPETPGAAHQRGFSLHSDKSHRRDGSKSNSNPPESPKDKASTKMHTHADPNLSMSEMQPSAMALEKSNMASLRAVLHKDRFGNAITDPDLSNPTRHRLERPLETIRAFEAAIDGTSSARRGSYIRPGDETTNGGHSRPVSYFAGDRSAYPNRSQNDLNGYHNGRLNMSRPDSYSESYNQYNNYSNPPPRVPRHAPRTNSDQWYGPDSQGYGPPQGHYLQNDHAASPSGSGSGNISMDQLAHSTDPSSVNSSLDRLQQQERSHQPQYQQRQMSDDQYARESFGFNGFGAAPQLEYSQSYGQGPSNGQFHNGYSNSKPVPAVPPKDGPPASQKGGSSPPKNEKRKSWFKRFSKS